MPLPIDNYFIRKDYRHNLTPASYDVGSNPAYWNSERMETAISYQYAVYVEAARLLRQRSATSILDVGCGPPVKLKALIPHDTVDIHLVDQPNAAPLARQLLPRATITPADLETVNFRLDIDFPVIVCADVIEHLVNPDPCLDFIRRHLGHDGLLVISTPERDVLRGSDCTHCPHPMHVREWNRAEFRSFLQSRGLEILEHKLLPQQRVGAAMTFMGSAMSALGFPPRWYSCQMAICKRQ